jgi:hypothetical protein
MEVWQKHLLGERKKLHKKVAYLEEFITTNERFLGFPAKNQELLKQQLGFMQEYERIMDIRISEFPPEPEPEPVAAPVMEKPKPVEKPLPDVKQRPLFDRRAAILKSTVAGRVIVPPRRP